MNFECEKYEGELRELREKVQVYENMMHSVQLFSTVVMDEKPIQHIISLINGWSYAHRQGNGELTAQEQTAMIRYWFERMKGCEWNDHTRTALFKNLQGKNNAC